MKQFSKLMLIAVGFGIVTVALLLLPSKPTGAAGSAPVMLTNTPLPVQGTVNAAQSGPWNVGISGTPTVNVSSLPAVQLSGTQTVMLANNEGQPLFTRDVDNAALQPFQNSICIAVGTVPIPPMDCGGTADRFTVPGQGRLVIEQVSGGCSQDVGTQVFGVDIDTTVHSNLQTHSFPLQAPPVSTLPATAYSTFLNHVTRMYADSGTSVVLSGISFNGLFALNANALCELTISGYLVNQ